jgi:hypothetical protein
LPRLPKRRIIYAAKKILLTGDAGRSALTQEEIVVTDKKPVILHFKLPQQKKTFLSLEGRAQ